MELPKSFVIKGDVWNIHRVNDLRDDSGNECYGITDYDNYTILIDEAIQGTHVEEETVMHEMVHALLHSLGIEFDTALDECIAHNVSALISKYFRIQVIQID